MEATSNPEPLADRNVTDDVIPKTHKAQWRNLISFWIFGLCNNFAYVVMLSAAHDILAEGEEENPALNTAQLNTTTTIPTTTHTSNLNISSSNHTYLECNTLSTGAILLADILPTLIVKLTFPFFLQRIPYSIKITLISLFALSSFVIVALAHTVWLSIVGGGVCQYRCGAGRDHLLESHHFLSHQCGVHVVVRDGGCRGGGCSSLCRIHISRPVASRFTPYNGDNSYPHVAHIFLPAN